MASDSSVKVLSLNCWGLKYVSKDRRERLLAIADALAADDHDVVCLQELWVNADYQLIRERLSKSLPHAKRWFSGALGSGLAIFTRFPILESSIRPYALNGSPLDVTGGDFFVGKSIVGIVCEHPRLGEVEVFNTHMFAKGGDDGDEWRRAHRLVGAWQFANLIRAAAQRGRHVIACGDFNSIPSSLTMTIIQSHAGLSDAWTASHDSSLFPTDAVFNPQHAIRDFGITCDSPLNSYSAGKPLNAVARRWQGKRLDYILYRSPSSTSASALTFESHSWNLVCSTSKVVLTGLVPGRHFSYSDHFGIEAVFDVRQTRPSSANSPPVRATGLGSDPLHASQASNESASGIRLSEFNSTELSSQASGALLTALGVAYVHASKTARVQLVECATCVAMALGLVVGSAWETHPWLNPIMILIAISLGWGGTTLLYSGFVYGRYECNMLVNAIEEIETLRSQKAQRSRPSSEGSLHH